MAASLWQTIQIISGVSFITVHVVFASTNTTTVVWIEAELFFTLGGRASCFRACFDAVLLPQSYQYPNLSEGADSVGGELRGDKECPFSDVTNCGRFWRKVPESDGVWVFSAELSVFQSNSSIKYKVPRWVLSFACHCYGLTSFRPVRPALLCCLLDRRAIQVWIQQPCYWNLPHLIPTAVPRHQRRFLFFFFFFSLSFLFSSFV